MRAMKILHVNKFLYRRGGAESYMFDVSSLQRDRGDETDYWGMSHPENQPCTYQDLFVDEADFGEGDRSFGAQLALLPRMIWSTSARARFAEVLDDFKPDVVHAHNIYHQLSPSILRATKAANVPFVLTMHDYKLVCPSYQLLANGEVCERCVTGGVHNAIRQRCNRDSLGASAAVALESGIHRVVRAYGPVTAFIAPSQFMADMVNKSGRYEQDIRHLPHFTELDRAQAEPGSNTRLVFAGRLSSEKGIDVLIQALAELTSAGTDIAVDIAGDGPDAEALRQQAASLPNVRFHGRLDKSGVDKLLHDAAAVVVPSTWHENQPMIILEAIAAGLPVLATDIGGIGELIDDGVSGILVPPRDPGALASAISELMASSELRRRMGLEARAFAARGFDATAHLDGLNSIYEAAIEQVAA